MKKTNENNSNKKWIMKVFIITIVLSLVLSYVTENGINNLNLVWAILILILVILTGITFDIIAAAVLVANEHEFHAKATKKVEGSKTSIKLIKNAPKVANICADVIGDICGVLSGSISTLICAKLYTMFNINITVILTAIVAALTVGGKAIGKEIADKNSTKIVHFVGKILSIKEK